MSVDAHQFDGYKYINLETYKKNEKPISTPVWFVIENNLIFIVTRSSTGKVKRLKNNPNVRIMPCGFRGEPKGKWVGGIAKFINSDESARIVNLRNKKYGITAKLVSLLTLRKGKFIVISIQIT
jgi:PPOX class probable F420-dependent enzyme